MKKLIINADDAGLSSAINEAVKQCFTEGVITGTSLISCGEAFDDACNALSEINKREAGVHLTLTGGFRPCTKTSSEVATLLEKGRFVSGYPGFMAKYYKHLVRPEHLYLELANQIQKVIDSGFTVTHLDSHEHVHMFPEVLKIVLTLAKEHAIPYLRFPLENSGLISMKFSVKDLVRHAGLKVFALGAKKRIQTSGIKYNDNFLGHFHSGRLDECIMDFMIRSMPEGINELAVHPAVKSPELLDESPWHKNAEKEMDVLMGGKWKKRLAEEGIDLISQAQVV